ncbi:hypothetical protein [Actinokineospora sp. HUAS TT18]|uniref:hypothetical protein n=1 Tax=Actinokineospora sp. HUAS TT18 TaxID=3447451 RepID=UPI003F51FA91
MPLDFGKELWKWDVSRFESADGIRESLTRAGGDYDDDSILFEATHTLVLDVVDAAGGVEQAHQRFHNAVGDIHGAYSRVRSKLGDLPEGGGMADPSVELAWYALEELLVWVRAFDDRLTRKAVDRRYKADQGLIPALADGPRRDAIIRARSSLLQGGIREVRYLAGLSIHMQSSQAGSKRSSVRSGAMVLPFPDHVDGPISHRWQLTYSDGRDAVSFADILWRSLERFMEDMIAAFEDHVPERFRQE